MDLLGDADKIAGVFDAGEIDAAGAERPAAAFLSGFCRLGSGSSLRRRFGYLRRFHGYGRRFRRAFATQ